MITGIIYRYVSPSNKSYIGQTIVGLNKRAKYTGEGYQKCPVFYRAILKYGFDNFTREILEEISANTKEELIKKLNKLEQFYIAKFNSLSPNGYNVRAGGENSIFAPDSKVHNTGSEHYNWRTDLQEEEMRQRYLNGETLKDISETLKISKETVKRHIEDMGILREKKYNYPVVKMDKQGNILKRWNSASEAEREEGAAKNSIGRCCRERRRPYKGVTYRFEGDTI